MRCLGRRTSCVSHRFETTTSRAGRSGLRSVYDYLLWYAQGQVAKSSIGSSIVRKRSARRRREHYQFVELPTARVVRWRSDRPRMRQTVCDVRLFNDRQHHGYHDRRSTAIFKLRVSGSSVSATKGSGWKTTADGMRRLDQCGAAWCHWRSTLATSAILEDFPVTADRRTCGRTLSTGSLPTRRCTSFRPTQRSSNAAC